MKVYTSNEISIALKIVRYELTKRIKRESEVEGDVDAATEIVDNIISLLSVVLALPTPAPTPEEPQP